MEHETIATAAAAARSKAGLLRNSPLQYLILSAMAGAYVGSYDREPYKAAVRAFLDRD